MLDNSIEFAFFRSDDWDNEDDNDSGTASSGSEDFKPVKSKKPTVKSRPTRRAQVKTKRKKKTSSYSESSDDSDSYSRPVPQRKTAQKVRYRIFLIFKSYLNVFVFGIMAQHKKTFV